MFFEVLRKNNPNIKIILFLWDKLEYSYWKDKIEYFDYVFSYDRVEALKNNFIFRPTFFIDNCLINMPIKKDIDLYYVGALKEEKRYKYLVNLKRYLESKNLKILFKLYTSKKTIKKLHLDQNENMIITKRISYEKNLELMKRSKVVLDIKYKNQDGLSLRIYEALAIGVKIITDSQDIKNYEFYNRSNIKVINTDVDIKNIDIEFFKSSFVKIDDHIKKKYSVEGFIDEIFNNIQK